VTDRPYAKFSRGWLYHLHGGRYVEDPTGFHLMAVLYTLKNTPIEYRTEQDSRFIEEIQTALKARRAYEDDRNNDTA